jgi:GT2 family glycosyltransferase
MPPSTSIVIAAYQEGENVRSTVDAIVASGAEDYDIIIVDDGSTDGCCDFARNEACRAISVLRQAHCGVAAARAAGAERATGDVLVFLDAHTAPQPGWHETLLRECHADGRRLLAPAVVDSRDRTQRGCGATFVDKNLRYRWIVPAGTEPYDIPIAPGGAFALTRALYAEIGGLDTMRTYGVEDAELSLRCWSYGVPCVGIPKAEIEHRFRAVTPYAVDPADYLHNVLRCAIVHFDGARLARIVDHVSTQTRFAVAARHVLASDVYARREHVRERRVNDDDWFFSRFAIDV